MQCVFVQDTVRNDFVSETLDDDDGDDENLG